MGEIAEEHLHGDGGDGACADVGDVAIQVSDFASRQVAGFAHGNASQREILRIGIQGRGDRRHRRLAATVCVLQAQDGQDYSHHNDAGSQTHWQPVAFFLFSGRRYEFRTKAHERNSTPVTQQVPHVDVVLRNNMKSRDT